MAQAYIDNGQIKITDNQGLEYEQVIAKYRRLSMIENRWSNLWLTVAFIFLVVTFSPLFYDFITTAQNWFFGIGTFVAGFIGGMYSDESSKSKNITEQKISDYNMAKAELQKKIMSLQKELAEHNSQLNIIEQQHKFNFKKENYA